MNEPNQLLPLSAACFLCLTIAHRDAICEYSQGSFIFVRVAITSHWCRQ
jgi:hypothetical protein